MTRRTRTLAFVLAAPVVLAGLWLWGLAHYAEAIPRPGADDGRQTDAIVVLTGGSFRLEAGAALLAQGRARKLFVTGVTAGVEAGRLLPGLSAEQIACCVILGRYADSTVGNARETAAWMAGEAYRSLRLVTGSYHMPRSLDEFRAAMPGMEIVPHPVFPGHVKQDGWWRWPGTASLIASEYSKYLARAALRRLGTGPSP